MKGTIKSKQTIGELFNQGSRYSAVGFLALYERKKQDKYSKTGRLAFIAGKKLGSAPLRSKAKRRLREAARAAGAPWCEYDVVFVAKKGIQKTEIATLTEDMTRLGNLLLRGRESNHNNPEEKPRECKESKKGAFSPTDKRTQKKRGAMRAFVVGVPRNIALLCISVYRHAISPLFPPSCRYVPTCSEYAMIAFKRFGFWKGLWLSVKRVGRCHPFVKGGYDPVPE